MISDVAENEDKLKVLEILAERLQTVSKNRQRSGHRW